MTVPLIRKYRSRDNCFISFFSPILLPSFLSPHSQLLDASWEPCLPRARNASRSSGRDAEPGRMERSGCRYSCRAAAFAGAAPRLQQRRELPAPRQGWSRSPAVHAGLGGTRDSPVQGWGSGRAGGRGRWQAAMGSEQQEQSSPTRQQRPLEAQPRAGLR